MRLLLDARGSASLELLLAMVAVSAFVALTAPGVSGMRRSRATTISGLVGLTAVE